LWSREGSDRELRDQSATESHDLLTATVFFLGSDGAAMRRGNDVAGAMPLMITSPRAASSVDKRSAMPLP
jgi:hypothetical protein